MTKEHFKCRFCKFETSNWKEAEEHFINKHKKSISKNKQPKKAKRKESSKRKNLLTNKNEILMERCITELRINATSTECYLKDKFDLFIKTPFIFQKGFYFSKRDFFYIVDFYFPQKNLMLEVDGEYHQTKEQKEKDIWREKKLKRTFHLKVLRYTNEQVYNNWFRILQDIQDIPDIQEVDTTYIQSPKGLKQIKKKYKCLGKKEKFKCDFCPVICKTLKRLQNHIKNSHK